MLNLFARKENEIDFVDIQGKLDTGNSSELGELLRELLDGNASKIILNFSKLDYISSNGLREILDAGKRLISTNGKLVMCRSNPIVYDVLRISGFSKMFEVYKSEEEAIASF